MKRENIKNFLNIFLLIYIFKVSYFLWIFKSWFFLKIEIFIFYNVLLNFIGRINKFLFLKFKIM